jgi:cysteinyl-tRNA synthetase
MADLNVQPPDAVLRVTEHIDEIIAFIQVLIDKSMLILHMMASALIIYLLMLNLMIQGKNINNESAVLSEAISNEESNHNVNTAKRSAKDFALWKLFPASEIVGWKSPWGNGRPGWHIECSAMTYSYFGKSLDIHSGGIDLQFPHHTNEIVQSECHHCDQQLSSSTPDWVKHWIHTGHLHIEGRKMSKGLKNFISIREYLDSRISRYPADDFRIFCMLSRYSVNVTYSEKRILEAAAYRDKVQQLLYLIEGLRAQRAKAGKTHCKPCKESKRLANKLTKTQLMVEECILDDFDTPYLLQLLSDLIANAKIYGVKVLNGDSLAFEPLKATEDYIRQMMQVFGIQFAKQEKSSNSTDSVDETNQRLQLALGILVDLRSGVRALTLSELKTTKQSIKEGNSAETHSEQTGTFCKKLMTLTDDARKDSLEKLGVQLDDLKDGSSIVKI